jgi:hypothetical protein
MQKREFFRLDVELPFQIAKNLTASTDTEFGSIPPNASSLARDYIHQLNLIDKTILHDLQLISQKSKLVAGVINALHTKLNVLQEMITHSDLIESLRLPIKKVNLSGGGFATVTHDVFKPQEEVVVSMTLPRTQPVVTNALNSNDFLGHINMTLKAKILGQDPIEGSSLYRTRGIFLDMDDQAQRPIIQFLNDQERQRVKVKKHFSED